MTCPAGFLDDIADLLTQWKPDHDREAAERGHPAAPVETAAEAPVAPDC